MIPVFFQNLARGESRVGDGEAVGVAAEIAEHLPGSPAPLPPYLNAHHVKVVVIGPHGNSQACCHYGQSGVK